MLREEAPLKVLPGCRDGSGWTGREEKAYDNMLR